MESVANSYTVEHFKSIVNDINRNPHPVYLQLLEIEKNKHKLSEDAYLWLLLRKAQAENLLYFHDKFANTVNYAQSLVTDATPVEIQASLNNYSGIAYERQGKYAESKSILEKSMAQAQKANLNFIYTQAKQNLAYTRSLTELYETSLSDLQEAYVEAFAMDDHFLIAVINESYGAVFGYMNEYEKSIDYYTRALDTYERLGYQPYVAEAIYGLASTYRYWGKYKQAIDKFQLYQKKIAFTPNQKISFLGAYGLGMTYAEKGDCEQALKVIDHALSLKGQEDYNAELFKRKASCFLAMGELSKAEDNIKLARDILFKMPELAGTKWVLDIEKLNGELAYARGEYQKGYQHILSFYQDYTDVLIKNSSQQLIRVRATMDLERQRVELSLLQQRNRVQQLQLAEQESKNRQQMYLIAIAVIFIIFIISIVIMQFKAKKKIFALSITDPLSEVFNRRYIFDYLDRLIENTTVRQGDLSILLFDIDDFKQVNDAHGHPFGDEVIYRIAKITQETLRVGDVVGRIGGEEFLCILPRTDVEQARTIANRLRENIHDALFAAEAGEQVTITVSVGIAALDKVANDRSSLYLLSDKALYQAKNQGKNQVVCYQD